MRPNRLTAARTAASASAPLVTSSLTTSRSSDSRSEEHTSELQSQSNLVCRLLLEKKNANDVTGRERELLEITRRYDSIAPNNPHAIHMPTHIYTRLGDWNVVIRSNLRAANAALHYPAGDKGQFVWDEFCHAIEYLVYAYLQQGNDRAAAAQIKRLRSTARLEPSFKIGRAHV